MECLSISDSMKTYVLSNTCLEFTVFLQEKLSFKIIDSGYSQIINLSTPMCANPTFWTLLTSSELQGLSKSN